MGSAFIVGEFVKSQELMIATLILRKMDEHSSATVFLFKILQ